MPKEVTSNCLEVVASTLRHTAHLAPCQIDNKRKRGQCTRNGSRPKAIKTHCQNGQKGKVVKKKTLEKKGPAAAASSRLHFQCCFSCNSSSRSSSTSKSSSMRMGQDKGSGSRMPGFRQVLQFSGLPSQNRVKQPAATDWVHYQRLTATYHGGAIYSSWILNSKQVLTALNQYSITPFCAHLKDGRSFWFWVQCRMPNAPRLQGWMVGKCMGLLQTYVQYLQIGNWIMFTTQTLNISHSAGVCPFPLLALHFSPCRFNFPDPLPSWQLQSFYFYPVFQSPSISSQFNYLHLPAETCGKVK